MEIKANLAHIKKTLPSEVTLVAVSKTKPIAVVMEAYEAGHRVFGENKVQEMTQKWEAMPKDIEWHMIGHLQRNKVKYMAEYVSLVHGVDSLKLLIEINKQAKKHDRIIPCLLQVHIAKEDTKFGLTPQELEQLISSEAYLELQNVKIKGLMGMATFTQNEQQVQSEFQFLRKTFEHLQQKIEGLDILSMGMSGDYALAIQEGSTMVRIGSSIFGARNYS